MSERRSSSPRPPRRANLGPGFDCAARRARPLERAPRRRPPRRRARGQRRGRGCRRAAPRRGPPGAARLRARSPRSSGRSFRFVNRIPLERGPRLLGGERRRRAGRRAAPCRASSSPPDAAARARRCRSRATPTTSPRRSRRRLPELVRAGATSCRAHRGRAAAARRSSSCRQRASTRASRARGCPSSSVTRRPPPPRPPAALLGAAIAARRRRAPRRGASTTVCTSRSGSPTRRVLAELRARPARGSRGRDALGLGPLGRRLGLGERAPTSLSGELRERFPTRASCPSTSSPTARRCAGRPATLDRPPRRDSERQRERLQQPDRSRPSATAPPSPTASTALPRARCSRRSASPTRTSPGRSSASRTTWIETMPCNLNQRVLARHVKDGIRAAGGTPIEFNTIAVSDGVSMGTDGHARLADLARGDRRLDRARRRAATCSTGSSASSAATRRSPPR